MRTFHLFLISIYLSHEHCYALSGLWSARNLASSHWSQGFSSNIRTKKKENLVLRELHPSFLVIRYYCCCKTWAEALITKFPLSVWYWESWLIILLTHCNHYTLLAIHTISPDNINTSPGREHFITSGQWVKWEILRDFKKTGLSKNL